jgi:hypothetical protein
MPAPVVHGGLLHGTVEALQDEGKDAPWESGADLTGGRCREPHARQVGQMTAGGVAMQNLSQEALHGGDRRQYAVAPPGIADLGTGCENRVRSQQRGEAPNARPNGETSCETRQRSAQLGNEHADLEGSTTRLLRLPDPFQDLCPDAPCAALLRKVFGIIPCISAAEGRDSGSAGVVGADAGGWSRPRPPLSFRR